MNHRLPPNTVPNEMQTELMQAYMSCLATGTYQGEYHPASPLVDFIIELAQINYQAVLDSGFLDMLLCMYVCDFRSGDTLPPSIQRLISRIDLDYSDSAMLGACTAALQMLCQQTDALAVVLAHPICALWPKNETLLYQFGPRSDERCLQWRELGPVISTRRLTVLPEILLLPITKELADSIRLNDVCVDIVEFSRQVLPVIFWTA